MAGKRKTFLNYSAASTFVIALGLTSMQDWIAYAKKKDANGKNVRPSDIPSNPWTVYAEELKSQGKKFKINDFIGCSLPRKSRANKDEAPTVPKASKASTAKPATVKAPKVSKADQKAEAVVVLSPYDIAANAIQELKLPNREAFYDLKRKNMLPAGVPRKPEETFKNTGWSGWGEFLGNGNKQVAKTVTA